MKNVRKYIVLIAIVTGAFFVIREFIEQESLMDYIEQDLRGFYYEEATSLSVLNTEPDFYTTLQINGLKHRMNNSHDHIDMSGLKGFKLNNFTCIKQLVDYKYPFKNEETLHVKSYLHGLQNDQYSYLIRISNNEEDNTLENCLFFTYEALKISKYLDFDLLHEDRIKDFIMTLSIAKTSYKETMAIIGISQELGLSLYSEELIQEKYSELFGNWMNSDSAQISWYFDLYYLSYIAAMGNVKDIMIDKSFKDDMVNLIQNQEMNLTFKLMAVDILENYGLLESECIDKIDDLIKDMDNSFYLKNGQYSMPVYPIGNISTTYYVYLYNKCQNNNNMDILLKSGLEELLGMGSFENYSFQELYQLCYLSMEYYIFSKEEVDIVTNYCIEAIDTQMNLSDIYFALTTIEMLNGNLMLLQQNHVDIINELVNEQLELSKARNIDVYEKMFCLFLCSNTNKLFESNNLYFIPIDYEEYMKNLENYLGEDIRLLYFYFVINKNIDNEFCIEDRLINEYKTKGIYQLNQESSVKSAYIQYIGEMMDKFNYKSLPDYPII
ncbi:MAG: hypothetical protein GX237_07825 [Clostridiales bacterium]|nr:hypothetical protein [Clostridiales bacterium]